jgi:DNA-binding transcriptional LysR family regulator
MEFRQLQLFIAVAEELHFGRAAMRVGMAQPPLSQQIRRLEAELGVTLLTRTSRRVALTPAGVQVLDGARDLLSRRADLKASVTRTARGEAGVLRLGFAPSSAFGIRPAIVRRFREALPQVALHIEDRESVDLGSALKSGDLDLAIVRGPFRRAGVECERLLVEPLMLVLPAAHPLTSTAHITLSSLADLPFVLFPRLTAPGLHDTITSMCLGAGFSPNIIQEAASWSSVVSLVEAGIGISIAPASARAICPQGVTFRDLEDADGRAEVALAYPQRPLPPAAEQFKRIAMDILA